MVRIPGSARTICEVYSSRIGTLRVWRDPARVDRAQAFATRIYEATGEEKVLCRHSAEASFAWTPSRD